MSRPYVYRCEHKILKRFYIGYRYANKVSASEDLGKFYFTSCKEIKNNFQEYNFEILSEYDSPIMAYEVEQVLLYNLRNDPLLINGDNFRTRNHISLDPKPVHYDPVNDNYLKKKRTARRLEQKRLREKKLETQEYDNLINLMRLEFTIFYCEEKLTTYLPGSKKFQETCSRIKNYKNQIENKLYG